MNAATINGRAAMSIYRIRRMPNGLINVTSRESGLRGTYNADGSYRHGDLRNVPASAVRAVTER